MSTQGSSSASRWSYSSRIRPRMSAREPTTSLTRSSGTPENSSTHSRPSFQTTPTARAIRVVANYAALGLSPGFLNHAFFSNRFQPFGVPFTCYPPDIIVPSALDRPKPLRHSGRRLKLLTLESGRSPPGDRQRNSQPHRRESDHGSGWDARGKSYEHNRK